MVYYSGEGVLLRKGGRPRYKLRSYTHCHTFGRYDGSRAYGDKLSLVSPAQERSTYDKCFYP